MMASDYFEEVCLDWVNDPTPSRFQSHEAFKRYARELPIISSTMRGYSRSAQQVDESALRALYSYGEKAYSIYTTALHQMA